MTDNIGDIVIPRTIIHDTSLTLTERVVKAITIQYPNITAEAIASLLGIHQKHVYRCRKNILGTDTHVSDVQSSDTHVSDVQSSDTHVSDVQSTSLETNKLASEEETTSVSSTSLTQKPNSAVDPFEWSSNFINSIKTYDEYNSKRERLRKILSRTDTMSEDQLNTLRENLEEKVTELKQN